MKKGKNKTDTISIERKGSEDKLRKMNEPEYLDPFEILDLEEKLDFSPYEGGGCINNNVAGCGAK